MSGLGVLAFRRADSHWFNSFTFYREWEVVRGRDGTQGTPSAPHPCGASPCTGGRWCAVSLRRPVSPPASHVAAERLPHPHAPPHGYMTRGWRNVSEKEDSHCRRVWGLRPGCRGQGQLSGGCVPQVVSPGRGHLILCLCDLCACPLGCATSPAVLPHHSLSKRQLLWASVSTTTTIIVIILTMGMALGIWFYALYIYQLISPSQQISETGSIILPNLQMNKLRHKRINDPPKVTHLVEPELEPRQLN